MFYNLLIYTGLQRKCKKNAPKFWYVRKKQYLCNVKQKSNRDMTKKQKVRVAHAIIWWCIALAVDAAVISEWVSIPECGLYSLIAGVAMFTAMSFAIWAVIRDFINHIIKD